MVEEPTVNVYSTRIQTGVQVESCSVESVSSAQKKSACCIWNLEQCGVCCNLKTMTHRVQGCVVGKPNVVTAVGIVRRIPRPSLSETVSTFSKLAFRDSDCATQVSFFTIKPCLHASISVWSCWHQFWGCCVVAEHTVQSKTCAQPLQNSKYSSSGKVFSTQKPPQRRPTRVCV